MTDRTYPIRAQLKLHTRNHGSPSTLMQRPVRFVSHPNRLEEGASLLWGASRRFIDRSRTCMNSALPDGRPVWVQRRISFSFDSISPAARYRRHALAVQLFRHTSRSNISFRASAPECAAALDHLHVPPCWPSRRGPGSTPYSATLPRDAPDPGEEKEPTLPGVAAGTDGTRCSNRSHSAHGNASGPIPSCQHGEELPPNARDFDIRQ